MAVFAPAAHAQTGGLGSAGVDEFIWQKMDQIRAPGLVAVVVRGDRVLWSKGYGYADIERQIPATPDTPFALASISKTFTATAVMQLWEQELVGLDDDVNDYLPYSVRNPRFPGEPITFRMLLEHDSGILTRPGVMEAPAGEDSPIPLGEFVEQYLTPGGGLYDPVKNFADVPPGTEHQYSPVGYALLGHLVERVTGLPFDLYTHAALFEPLGMVDTTWRIADFPHLSIAPAIRYLYDHTTQQYFPGEHVARNGYPAGMLRSSGNQLAKWLIAHMNGGRYNGVQLLQPETTLLMQQPAYTRLSDLGAYTYGYGMGFEVIERAPTETDLTIGHGGLLPGVATEMHYRPGTGVGVIILCNTGPGILLPTGPLVIEGWQYALYSMIGARLLDEAEAAP